MRRLLAALAGRFRSVARAWDAFFFSPSDPTAVGLIRLLTGLLLLWSLLVTGLDLRATLGSEGWVDPEVAAGRMGGLGWSLWLFVPDRFLVPAWVLGMVVTALFALGLGGRTTAIVAWMVAVSTARRAPATLFGFDPVVSTWALYLAVTGAGGQAVSLDRFLARWRAAWREARKPKVPGRLMPTLPPGRPGPTISANLALRLIQLHLCLIYASAGLAKLQAPAWWDGSAAGKLLGNPEFRPIDLTVLAPLPGFESLVNLATHLTVAFEIGYPILIWLRPWRTPMLVLAALLHAGIALTMGLYEFSIAMLIGNLAFVSGTWLRGLVTGPSQPRARVLFDGACPKCRASMAFLKAADPDRLVEPIDLTEVDVSAVHPSLSKEACLRSMHLVRPDGRVLAGYDAVFALARLLPMTWLPSVVGWIPGVAPIGRRLYNGIASTRSRDQPCTDQACGLHPPGGRRDRSTPTEAQETGRSSR